MSSDGSCSWGMEDDDFEEEEVPKIEESFFKIDSTIIEKDEIVRLVKSDDPKDKEQLNSLTAVIIKVDKYDVFEYLLDNGYKLDILNSRKQTAAHLGFYKCFEKAGKHRDASFNIYAVNYYGCSNDLLKTIINKELVKNLCKLNYTDSYGLTYLHIACFMGHKDLVIKCLDAEINVNTCFYHEDCYHKNFTALHFAAVNTSESATDIVDLLLKYGANVEAKDWQGRMPLHLACSTFHNEYGLKSLNCEVDSTRSFVEDPHNFQSTNLKIFHALINKCSNIDARDKFDNTMLLSIFPKKYGKFERFNSNWNDCRLPIQETAVKFAILVQNGADLNATNDHENTILHLIVGNLQRWRRSIGGGEEIRFDDDYHIEMIKKLLECNPKIDINSKNDDGETALQLAVENISYDIVKLLLDHNADLTCLKYSHVYELFNYPNFVPNFECIRDTVNIVNLFENEGYSLSPQASLEVMEFLMHDRENCECRSNGYIKDYALYYGSGKHLRQLLDAIFDEERFLTMYLQANATELREYYNCIIHAEFYHDEESFGLLSELMDHWEENLDDFVQSVEIPEEVERIKSEKLDDNTTLYDIMKKHYHFIPLHILNSFDEDIFGYFGYCKNVIKGHFAKSILRRYVEKSAEVLLKTLYLALPDLCCRLVVDYLSNEDVLNLCSAVTIRDPKEKRLLIK